MPPLGIVLVVTTTASTHAPPLETLTSTLCFCFVSPLTCTAHTPWREGSSPPVTGSFEVRAVYLGTRKPVIQPLTLLQSACASSRKPRRISARPEIVRRLLTDWA